MCEISHFVLLYGTVFYTISRAERRRCLDCFSRDRRLCPSCTNKFASTSGGAEGSSSSRTTLGLATRRTLGARGGASSRFFLYLFSGSGSGSGSGAGSGSVSTTSVFSTSAISFLLTKHKSGRPMTSFQIQDVSRHVSQFNF